MDLIIAIGVGVLIYLLLKGNKSKTEEKMTTEEMWSVAEVNMERVMAKSPNLEEHLQDERDMVRAMEMDMIRLRERFKHDPTKQREIAQDWMDYSGAVERMKFASEMLDCDMSRDAYDSYGERVKEPHMAVQEIGKRIENMLGEESSSKLVHDRLKKKAEAADEILSKNETKSSSS
ncbi:MAG: hypothetical protein ABIA92_01365 [Patescibacteria group bacterium]